MLFAGRPSVTIACPTYFHFNSNSTPHPRIFSFYLPAFSLSLFHTYSYYRHWTIQAGKPFEYVQWNNERCQQSVLQKKNKNKKEPKRKNTRPYLNNCGSKATSSKHHRHRHDLPAPENPLTE